MKHHPPIETWPWFVIADQSITGHSNKSTVAAFGRHGAVRQRCQPTKVFAVVFFMICMASGFNFRSQMRSTTVKTYSLTYSNILRHIVKHIRYGSQTWPFSCKAPASKPKAKAWAKSKRWPTCWRPGDWSLPSAVKPWLRPWIQGPNGRLGGFAPQGRWKMTNSPVEWFFWIKCSVSTRN